MPRSFLTSLYVIIHVKLHNNPKKYVLLLSPFYRQRLNECSRFAHFTELVNDELENKLKQSDSESFLLTITLYCFSISLFFRVPDFFELFS